MHSCFYEGSVVHRRLVPLGHGFRYRLAMFYLDLDELDAANPIDGGLPAAGIDHSFCSNWRWSARRTAVARFAREDHWGDPNIPLRQSVCRLLQQHGVNDAIGPIRLLTSPRYLGYAMNPVSFYYCYQRDGQLRAVVAEVHNTPWGERHCYVLGQSGYWSRGDRPPQGKEFHVSPFMQMDLQYRWRLSVPGETLRVQIQNLQQSSMIFQAGMQLRRHAWTAANLRSLLWRYPLLTHRVALGIYWQALRLWWKSVPYVPHPSGVSGNANDSEAVNRRESADA